MQRRGFLQGALAAPASAMWAGCARAQAADPAPPAVDVVGLDGGMRTLAGADLKDLRRALRGGLLLPRDEGYDDARRLVNRVFDRRPAFIVQATGAADVALAVAFAQEKSLLLAVKGGGHSDFGVSGHDGAMMLDLSPLRGVRIDADARRAWVAGATPAGLIDHEAGARGLAVPLGGASTVGIGGLALGGGFGKLARRHGLTLDAIRAVEVVCADGQIRRASPAENPDLFWGLRGGGGNFGVATALEFQLHPIPPRVLAGEIVFPFSQLRRVLAAYGDFTAEAPDDLYVELFLACRGSTEAGVLQLGVCYLGDPARAERALRPLRRFGQVLRDGVKAVSYPTAQGAEAHAAARAPTTAPARETVFRSAFLEGMGTAFASTLADSLEPDPDRRINMLFLHGGGAISWTPPSDTAFSHRAASHDMILIASWPRGEGEARHADHVRQAWSRLRPFTRGFYVNDMAGGVAPAEVAANYGPNAARLAAVKARWDPQNLFRLNANILPAPASARGHL